MCMTPNQRGQFSFRLMSWVWLFGGYTFPFALSGLVCMSYLKVRIFAVLEGLVGRIACLGLELLLQETRV